MAFLQPDHFADISDAIIVDLQRRLARGTANDHVALRGTYRAHVLREYMDEFGLGGKEASGLLITDDGTALTADGRRFEGAPSYAEFIEYVRKGRS